MGTCFHHLPEGAVMPISDVDFQTLAVRVDAMQKQLEEIKPNMWFVTSLRAICFTFAASLISAVIWFVHTFATMQSDVTNQKETNARLEKQMDQYRAEQTSLIKDVLDRLPPKKVYGALVYNGKIVRVLP